MLTGIIIGVVFTAILFAMLNPCPHSETEHVSKCVRCGKVFDDGLSRMRGER